MNKKAPVSIAPISRNPVYTDPKVMPWADMRWSRHKKRWVSIDQRTPEEKKSSRIIEKEERNKKRKWEFISRRIPQGWYRGVTCGLGWFKLISQLVEDIDETWRKIGELHPELYWAPVQIKEKFGGLRFYVVPLTKLPARASKSYREVYGRCWRITNALIREAESASTQICEKCSERAIREEIDGWTVTLCKECLEARMPHNGKKEEKSNGK